MAKRNLIIVHRGPEYEKDFREIAKKVVAIDKDISVYAVPNQSTVQLPSLAWMWPTLVVSLTSEYRLQIKRGSVLNNLKIEKLAQYKVFREADISTPATLPFQFGTMLDPLLFGEFVLIKPMDLGITSTGLGVQLFRRHRLERMQPNDFPPDHPIHQARDGYLVQRFVDTGPNPSFHRIQTFFGKVIYSWHSTLQQPRCPLDAPDAEIERTVIASQGGEKNRKLVKEPDIIALAEKVGAAFPTIPLLAIDVLREEGSGKLYVLECNPGGNTWHFSSKIGAKLRLGFGKAEVNGAERAHQIARRMFMEQYGAFDIVARTLVEKTHQLAS
ncbi:hypothetical protein [Taklimakanibacter lacteus]|uniref:hypothetical protein n=1 Tax=Taklimakanibacter lacteus TaxID=2268456 RepID=UPI000E6638FB